MDEWRYRALCASSIFLNSQITEPTLIDTCKKLSSRYLQEAQSLNAHKHLGLAFEELANDIEPEKFLTKEIGVTMRLVSPASSGGVEHSLIKWLKSSLSNIDGNRDRDYVKSVMELVEKYRPYPLKLITSNIRKLIENDIKEKKNDALIACCNYEINETNVRTNLLQIAVETNFVQEASHLLVYGYSSDLLSIFLQHAGMKKSSNIIIAVAECPNYFGVDSAPMQVQRLASLGFQCVLVPAASIEKYIKVNKPNRVLMGANFIVEDGIINTMGSHLIASIAKASNCKPTVIARSSKFWPTELWEVEKNNVLEMERPMKYALPEWIFQQPNVSTKAYAYDLIPFNMFYEFISDIGVFTEKDDIRKNLMTYFKPNIIKKGVRQ